MIFKNTTSSVLVHYWIKLKYLPIYKPTKYSHVDNFRDGSEKSEIAYIQSTLRSRYFTECKIAGDDSSIAVGFHEWSRNFSWSFPLGFLSFSYFNW